MKSTAESLVPEDPPADASTPPSHNFLRDFHFPDRRIGPFDAQGSGFFISSTGHIVTSKHVIDGATRIVVTTKTGERIDARVVGTDTVTDLALLEIDTPPHTPRPFVRFSQRAVRVGERVIAIGNPFGLNGSVTSGILSAKGRNVGMGSFDDYLQIDAAINRGNSGGPTFDQTGEVIGVNTAIFSPTGSSVGIAFAIPALTAAEVVEHLRQRGYVERGWLGVEVQGLTPQIAAALARAETSGVLVIDVRHDGPSANSGIRAGDVIERVGDTDIDDARHFARRISGATPGSIIALRVRRGSEAIDLAALVGRRESRHDRPKSGVAAKGSIDLKLAVTPSAGPDGATGGLIVTGIEGGASGESSDLDVLVGDVILRASSRDVSTTADFETERAAAAARGLTHLLVMIRRDDAQRFVAIPVRAPEPRTVAGDHIMVTLR